MRIKNKKKLNNAATQAQSHIGQSVGPNGQPDERHYRLNLKIFRFTVGGAIIALLAAGFTGWQAYIAKDTETRQLRAYIAIESTDIPKIEEGTTLHINAIMENLGQTPAYNAGWISGINVMKYPLPEEIGNDTCTHVMNLPKRSKWVIAKKAFVEKIRPAPFNAAEVKDIKEGKAAVYFHGRVCYEDIFQEVHHTDFCMYWKLENGKAGNASFCENGNHGN